ncbi:hypothetical protein GWN49_09795 [Candidatus Bathyarchaeota archaeon]|nr:hypothetical protein [Candidatus Bathyarchaeota archaeon]
MAAAAVYLACRQCKLLRTLDELAQAAGIAKLDVARYYRLLVETLVMLYRLRRLAII